MVAIGKEARKILESRVGLPFDQICELSVCDEIALVKARTGKDLNFSKNYDRRKIGRGNPLLALKKMTSMEEVNAKIDAL